jgi:hypothetical protein
MGMGMEGDPSNTLPQKYTSMMESFQFRKKCEDERGWEGISHDYFVQKWRSKRTSGDFSGYKIIPSYLHKYTRSKQGLKVSDVHTIYYEQSGNPGGHVSATTANPSAVLSLGHMRLSSMESFYQM